MTGFVPWPALATLAAAAGCLYLTRITLSYRDTPGGLLFTAMVAGMSGCAIVYCFAFLVVDPVVLRLGLEITFWSIVTIAGSFFFVFATVYTGHSHLVYSWLVLAVIGAAGIFVILFLTNPLHQLIWSDFQVVQTAGAAGVSYTRELGFFAYFVYVSGILFVATFLLLETVVNYGTLYRKQAVALALTPSFPSVAGIAWLFELGPVPELNFLAFAMLPHVFLDVYALFWGQLFDFQPATRRIGTRAAIDDVGNPILTVDNEGRIIDMNEAATQQFDLETPEDFGNFLNEVVSGDSFTPDSSGDEITLLSDGNWRTYDVVSSPLQDATGATVGYTITLHDVTDDRRREQRLEVLNRVLRHNLRNDLNVVAGFAESIQSDPNAEQVPELAEHIKVTSQDLMDLGEKARFLDTEIDAGEIVRKPISIENLLRSVAEDLHENGPAGRIIVETDEIRDFETDPTLLRAAIEAATENGLDHNDAPEPTVWLSASATADGLEITIRDNGPGLPSQERQVLEAGGETALTHGSGLGHWLISWCVRQLGGTVSYEIDDGTAIVLQFPPAGFSH